MPGTVDNDVVSAGQAVKAGDDLVFIEAMKMENDIVSDKDGVVASVNVNKGDAVETGAVVATLNA